MKRRSGFLSPNLWPEEPWRAPSKALLRASPDTRRRVAKAAAQIALLANRVSDPEAIAALEAAARGQYGDSAVRSALQAAVDKHDDAYFDADEAGDGATSAQQFCVARALSSLWFAMATDPDEAARQALYEARHSLPDGDHDALVEMIGRELKSGG